MTDEYTVLIADDSAFSRKIVKSALCDTEFRIVAEAANGTEAIDRFRESNPDLVLLDIIMPDRDGTSALRDIMELDPDGRVLMLSSMGTEEVVAQCLCLGARNFVQKPFSKDALVGQLRDLVRA